MSNSTCVYIRRFDEAKAFEDKERKFLDTISDKEIISFFKEGKNIRDIMEEIEDAYGESYTEEEYIFNYLDAYDFEEYINKRFPKIEIKHVVHDEELIVGKGALNYG